MIEPVQGEGGVNIPPEGFLPGLRHLADEHGLLLSLTKCRPVAGERGIGSHTSILALRQTS